MGEKKEIVRNYVSQGLTVVRATSIAGIKKSTYYYHSNGRHKGKLPTTHTLKTDEGMVPNEKVVEEIIKLIDPEYHDYGYQIVTELLQRKFYKINHKKVYRLMKENQLLHPPVIKKNTMEKTFIQYTIPPLEEPFATVESDIKYVYIHGENKNALLLTFLCTFTRFAPTWKLQYHIRHTDVIYLVERFVSHPEVAKKLENKKIKVKIRTDNGSQFVAKKLAEVLEQFGIDHEFIHPATPQENGHIESFHSTVTKLVCNRNMFQNIEHARKIFTEFFFQYNYTRVMRSLLKYPPFIFLRLWDTGIIGIKTDKNNKEVFYFKEKPTPELVADLSSDITLDKYKNSIFENHF